MGIIDGWNRINDLCLRQQPRILEMGTGWISEINSADKDRGGVFEFVSPARGSQGFSLDRRIP